MMGRKHKKIEFYEDSNGCWICTSHARNQSGYPRITYKGKYPHMSRYLYEKNYGKIPDGLIIRHKCDNPNCINLAHLELGTHKQNAQDCIDRGRQPVGEKHHCNKLTEEQAKFILKSDIGPRELGRKYGVAHTTIIRIRQRKKWKYLGGD